MEIEITISQGLEIVETGMAHLRNFLPLTPQHRLPRQVRIDEKQRKTRWPAQGCRMKFMGRPDAQLERPHSILDNRREINRLKCENRRKRKLLKQQVIRFG